MFTRAGQCWSLCCDSVSGGGAEREQWGLLHSARCQSLPLLPTIKLGPTSADSRVGGLVRALGPSPTTSPVRLGVSPAAAPTPTGVFTQRFEALFRCAGALGCAVCFAPPPFLPVHLCANVGPRGLLAVALPTLFVPQSATSLPSRCCKSSPPWLSVSAPPTGLDECFFFISLVVGLPFGSVFCQFWLFLFLSCCCPFGCARRRSVSTYASILVLHPNMVMLMK